MLTSSIRTLEPKFVAELFRSYTKKAKTYLDYKYKNLVFKYLDNYEMTNEEIYFTALEIFSGEQEITQMMSNKNATGEMISWALTFMTSYISFWDAPSGFEFILSDSGMVTEYEGTHEVTGGLLNSKHIYSLYKCTEEHKQEYCDIFTETLLQYEDYNIFVLSSTRALVMINPFYKICLGENSNENINSLLGNNEIWPSTLKNKNLFKSPDVSYIKKNKTSDNDDFMYIPKKLRDEEIIYINNLILSRSNKLIGFKNIENIFSSIVYFWYSLKSFQQVIYKKNMVDKNNNLLLKNIYKVIEFAETKGYYVNLESIISLVNDMNYYKLKDIKENNYIVWHILNNEELINHPDLKFLSNDSDIRKYLADRLNSLNNKKNDIM